MVLVRVTEERIAALGPLERLDHPWEPARCGRALRAELWHWLEDVAGWVNHEYGWGVERLIPPCWPRHPHIAHELAVLADQRYSAGQSFHGGAPGGVAPVQPAHVSRADDHPAGEPVRQPARRLACRGPVPHLQLAASVTERRALFDGDASTTSRHLALVDLDTAEVIDDGGRAMNTHPEGTHRETPAPASGGRLVRPGADSSRPLPDRRVLSGHTRSADRLPSGSGFADPTPGLDEAGRAVPCTVCGAGLSQPRIDYGLNTCPRCRPAAGTSGRRGSGHQLGARAAMSAGARRRSPKDEAAQRDRLEAFHQQLTDQVLTLADGPSWKAWLATAAKFHHYSFNNTVAIMLQRPDASQVAGYRTWQSLGRQVRKGEQGIQILAPVTRRATVENDDDGRTDATGRRAGGRTSHTAGTAATGPGSDAGKQPEAASGPRRLVGVRIAFVFDLSQTDPIPGAPPLPSAPQPRSCSPGRPRWAVGRASTPGRRGGLHRSRARPRRRCPRSH